MNLSTGERVNDGECLLHLEEAPDERMKPLPASPDMALQRLLDAGWRAVVWMNGAHIVAATAELRAHLRQARHAPWAGSLQEVHTLLAVGSVWADDVAPALQHACAAMSSPAPGIGRFRPMLTAVLKFCHWRTRDIAGFYRIGRAGAVHAHAVTLLPAVACLSIEAAAEAEQLRFKLSERLARDAVRLSGHLVDGQANASLLPACVLAQLSYEAGALDDAERMLRGRLSALANCGSVESALIAFPVLAKIALAHGNLSLALSLLRRGEEVGVTRGWPRLVVRCLAEAAIALAGVQQLDVARREYSRLRHLAGRFGCGSYSGPLDGWPIELAGVRLAMADGRAEGVVTALGQMRDTAINGHHPALVVRVTILLSSALFEAANVQLARDELLWALRQGADTGLFRTFLDDMRLIEPVLRDIRGFPQRGCPGHVGAYIDSLLTANSTLSSRRPRIRHNEGIDDALSSRETVVLSLISLGLSNKYIGRELQIAPETVKSHVKSIFRKLATKTRAEAVLRATELGLL